MATPNILQETQERNKDDVNVAVASADAPSYTEERSVPLSVDLNGNLRVVIDNSVLGAYDYTKYIRLQDDFLSSGTSTLNVGSLGWSVGNGATTMLAPETNAIGIVRRSTGTSTGTTASLYLSNGTHDVLNSTHTFTIIWRCRVPSSDATTTVRIGAANSSTSATPNEGIYFEKLDADTNWFAVTRSSSTQAARTDTNVAVGSSFDVFRIMCAGGVITFYINGILVATRSTNVPTSTGVNPGTTITNSENAAKFLEHDYFELDLSGLTR
jgi:hypothetical protein